MFKRRMKTVICVLGMSCQHCANKVKINLEKLDDIEKVKVDLDKKQVIIFSSEKIDIKKVKEKIEELDYKLEKVLEENV